MTATSLENATSNVSYVTKLTIYVIQTLPNLTYPFFIDNVPCQYLYCIVEAALVQTKSDSINQMITITDDFD